MNAAGPPATSHRLAAALGAAVLMLCTPPAARAAAAHVHGVATLDVAIDARTLTIALDSPLDNLLGFEHAPRTAAERQQADALIASLKAAGSLFKIDPAAQCTLDQVELAASVLGLGASDPKEAGHADMDATFTFRCGDARKAAAIDVGLFAFPHLQTLQVQVAAPGGQFQRTLRRPDGRLLLSR